MPQPLSRLTRRKHGLRIGPEALLNRPTLAAKVMYVVGMWSEIDSLFIELATSYLKADIIAVNALLQAVSSTEGRRAAVSAAAEVSIEDPRDRLVFKATVRAINSFRERRNEFAHRLWGVHDDVPDSLCLIDPKFVTRRHAENEIEVRKTLGGMTEPGDILFRPKAPIDFKNVTVYRDTDLERDIRDARRCTVLMIYLDNFCHALGHGRATMHRQLLSDPLVQQALERLSNESGAQVQSPKPDKSLNDQ